MGLDKISALESYTELKCLWLNNNSIKAIGGLGNQTKLKSLFLQNNAIDKIQNLHNMPNLNTLNLSGNLIRKIENLECCHKLSHLDLSNNLISSSNDCENLKYCQNLSYLNLENNKLDDIHILDILAEIPDLRVLNLKGNSFISAMSNPKFNILSKLRNLTYLNDFPVKKTDYILADAYIRGGDEQLRIARDNILKEKEESVANSANYMMKIKTTNLKKREIKSFIARILEHVCEKNEFRNEKERRIIEIETIE
ncbi:MAG: hypothetical protein MHMPM18_001538 [Marteilia pararefringens]